MEKLKPCPFCGKKPIVFVVEQTTVMSEPFVCATICCTNCEATIKRTKMGYVQKDIIKNIVCEAWNRRVEDE